MTYLGEGQGAKTANWGPGHHPVTCNGIKRYVLYTRYHNKPKGIWFWRYLDQLRTIKVKTLLFGSILGVIEGYSGPPDATHVHMIVCWGTYHVYFIMKSNWHIVLYMFGETTSLYGTKTLLWVHFRGQKRVFWALGATQFHNL